MNNLYLLLICFTFIKCNSFSKNCSEKYFKFGSSQFSAKGCLIRELENGEWSIFNKDNNLLEKGFYEDGLKIGKWIYPLNMNDSIIVWKKFNNKNLKLSFSIPELLDVNVDSIDFIKFSNNDTSKPFDLVLSIFDISQTEREIEEYYKQGEDELSRKGVSFFVEKNKINTSNRTIFFNEYTIDVGKSKKNKILNIYGMLTDNLIYEISCKYDERIEGTSKIIFYTILTSSFYNNKRFIYPLDKIEFIKIE